MEGRRFIRRQRRRTRGESTILPLTSTTPLLSNALSCWYCDVKIVCFNESLYHIGQKYGRFLRLWFSIGTGFSLSLLIGVTMVLIWELVTISWLTHQSNTLSDLFESLLFGINPWALRFKMSIFDLGYLVIATIISVAVHEFGHATAAASEGIQLEYIAIFLAILFPGALVAFNYELLHSKPRFSALRIYCAGVWHNAVCCAACGVALLLLPFLLSPLYIHGDGPMVLDVSPSSPLSGYLSPGDIIVSLDGSKITNNMDWTEISNSLNKQSPTSSNPEFMKGYRTISKTYCAPNILVENSERFSSASNQSICPVNHVAFLSLPCFDLTAHFASIGYCLSSADAVNLRSCGPLGMSENNCICSENELCLSPVQEPGIMWAEITYRNPNNNHCKEFTSNVSVYEEKCDKSFLYVGDAFSMARSVRLTSYQPRFTLPFGAFLPDMVEKIFVWTFQVSVALAVLNSLPVFCLDGESILEVSSLYVTVFSSRTRRLFLRGCLFGGSMITCLVFVRTLLVKFW